METQAYEQKDADFGAPTALELIDNQIERLDKTIAILSSRLAVVSKDEMDSELRGVPVAAPRSPVAARSQRLADLCGSLDQIIERLDI